MGHNKQSGGFREAPQQKLEGYEEIPTADELDRAKRGKPGDQPGGAQASTDKLIDQSIDPITGQPLSEALRARPVYPSPPGEDPPPGGSRKAPGE